MSPIACTICFAAVAYLLGGVPFSLLLGLARGVDIRKIGSGNVGATNLGRALGRRWAIGAFLLDFSKGLLPVVAARAFAGADPGVSPSGAGRDPRLAGTEGGWAFALIGLAAVLGHVFPVYLRFRGGKGVATTFGVMAGLSWLSSALAATVWGVLFGVLRTVSVASLAAASSLPLGAWIFERARPDGAFPAIEAFAVAVAILVLVRHGSNLRRLLRGQEPTFQGKVPSGEHGEVERGQP